MASLLRNKIFRIHNWMDRNEKAKFLLMILCVGIPNLIIQLSSDYHMVIFGAFLLLFVCLFTLNRMSYLTGKMKFDHSVYKLPEVGERIVITKEFYYNHNGSPSGCYMVKKDPKNTRNFWKIGVGSEWVFQKSINGPCDVVMCLSDDSKNMSLYFSDLKNHWKTKKYIRDNKLKKLGI